MCILLVGFQLAIIASVWFGPKENRMNLIGVFALAPFVFIAAASTFAFAFMQRADANDSTTIADELQPRRLDPQFFQCFAMAVCIVELPMFLLG